MTRPGWYNYSKLHQAWGLLIDAAEYVSFHTSMLGYDALLARQRGFHCLWSPVHSFITMLSDWCSYFCLALAREPCRLFLLFGGEGKSLSIRRNTLRCAHRITGPVNAPWSQMDPSCLTLSTLVCVCHRCLRMLAGYAFEEAYTRS